MATDIQFKGHKVTIKPAPETVGYGLKDQGKSKPELILVNKKKGEAPDAAMERVSVRHEGFSWHRLDDDYVLDNQVGFGLPENAKGEVSFDVKEGPAGDITLVPQDVEEFIEMMVALEKG